MCVALDHDVLDGRAHDSRRLVLNNVNNGLLRMLRVHGKIDKRRLKRHRIDDCPRKCTYRNNAKVVMVMVY